jgi:DNA-binding SARP family transcriptional activator
MVEIVRDWTWQELQRELLIWAGKELKTTQFYEWLPYALIAKKRIYSDRDRAKLLKFAELMARHKRLEMASEKLIEYMTLNPGEFPNEQQN